MALFDDLKEKLSHAGQSAVQKTKEVADIAKLNSFIYDEEKRINNNYLEIGKLYVSQHADEQGTEYDEKIAAIRESEEKIRDYRLKITEIKGSVACAKCGAQVPVGAAFCCTCGSPMSEEEPAEAAEETAESVVEEIMPDMSAAEETVESVEEQ